MEFDWKNPDYVPVFQQRAARLQRIRKAGAGAVETLKVHYKNNPADFINDWGVTLDPRNVERDLPALIPFVLFPLQREWIEWVLQRWRERRPGITEKSRDFGLSWLAVSLACTMCLHLPGMAIGFGSRKEEYVDKIGAPKSLFYKARIFMQNLPREFRGGWNAQLHAPHMRLTFPETQSNISGEAGDNIGRGDRTGIYFVDEAAYLERPDAIEASLSQTTNCRIDISSARGMANPFAQKRHGGKIPVFTCHWRSDPRKDDAWYEKQKEDLDPITVAQEIDIDYSASVEGVLIPSAWVQAATGAAEKLGIKITGARRAAYDSADEGEDQNAVASAKGIEVDFISQWSGKGSDTFHSVVRAFSICDELDCWELTYDSDGIGASVRGDARVINEQRSQSRVRTRAVVAFRGSGEVSDPHKEDVPGRKNEDFFANAKAQAWWALRMRFQRTFRAVTDGTSFPHDQLISLRQDMPLYSQVVMELSQTTYAVNTIGKIVINKTPEGTKSPNLADATMMLFAPQRRRGLRLPTGAAAAMAQTGRL